MVWILCVAVMAVFGFLCMLWALLGWRIPGSREGILVCFATPGFPEQGFLRRYLFLRDLGLLECPLVVIDRGLSEPERRKLAQTRCGIELCGLGELSERLELERNRIDGTGNGNHSGRDQRRGLSKL